MTLTHEQKTAAAGVLARLQYAITASCGQTIDDALLRAGLDPVTAETLINELVAIGSVQDDAPSDRGPHPDWLRDLFLKLVRTTDEDTKPTNDRLSRLSRCLLAIPRFDHYEALVHSFSGEWAQCPRPGRHDDAVPSDVPAPVTSDAEQVDSALGFLSYPPRMEYILSGATELSTYFTADVVDFLNGIQIHITNDLNRYDVDTIMEIPGVTARTIAQLYDYLRNQLA